jgi:hypothetical protein
LHETDASQIRTKGVNPDRDNGNTNEEIKLDLNTKKNENRCRLSERKRKCPATRNEDFFMGLELNNKEHKNDNLIITKIQGA